MAYSPSAELSLDVRLLFAQLGIVVPSQCHPDDFYKGVISLGDQYEGSFMEDVCKHICEVVELCYPAAKVVGEPDYQATLAVWAEKAELGLEVDLDDREEFQKFIYNLDGLKLDNWSDVPDLILEKYDCLTEGGVPFDSLGDFLESCGIYEEKGDVCVVYSAKIYSGWILGNVQAMPDYTEYPDEKSMKAARVDEYLSGLEVPQVIQNYILGSEVEDIIFNDLLSGIEWAEGDDGTCYVFG